MPNRDVFRQILLRRFVRANRAPADHPPRSRRLAASKRRWSSSTQKAFVLTRIAFAAIILTLVLPTLAAVREVDAIGLTVNDLGCQLHFFTNTLPFQLVSISDTSGTEEDALLGLSGARLRIATLRLGDENITLTEHLGKKGRPIPQDSRSYDRWFQHIAIVVSDMSKAYARFVDHKVRHVSTAPQTLPDWNKDAAGITFYFLDPEDHVLEVIWFPPGKGDPKWQTPTDQLFLGIDHTAIVVSDTDRSLAFYRDLLGLRVAGESENYGIEQEHLNQVFGARLRITGLRTEHGPGIEFLEYIAPPGGRPVPSDRQANDLIFWRTDLGVDHQLDELAEKLKNSGARFVSKGVASASGNPRAAGKTLIVRDPDGHALQLTELNSNATASAAR